MDQPKDKDDNHSFSLDEWKEWVQVVIDELFSIDDDDDELPGVDDELPGVDDELPGVDVELPGVEDNEYCIVIE